MKKPEEAEDIDYFDFDFVCVGAPSYAWHPLTDEEFPGKKNSRRIVNRAKSQPSAPKVPGKNALIFVHLLWPSHGVLMKLLQRARICGSSLST